MRTAARASAPPPIPAATYNIAPGASLTGSFIGLRFADGTVNVKDNASITGGSDGILANTLATVNNAGTISGTGAG